MHQIQILEIFLIFEFTLLANLFECLPITVTLSPGERLNIFLSDWAGENSYCASTIDNSPIENLRYVSNPLKHSLREFRLYHVTNSTTKVE